MFARCVIHGSFFFCYFVFSFVFICSYAPERQEQPAPTYPIYVGSSSVVVNLIL